MKFHRLLSETKRNPKVVSGFKKCLSIFGNRTKQERIYHCEMTNDSCLAMAVAMAPFDSGFDPRQRRHLICAQLVSQLIRVQLVLLD